MSFTESFIAWINNVGGAVALIFIQGARVKSTPRVSSRQETTGIHDDREVRPSGVFISDVPPGRRCVLLRCSTPQQDALRRKNRLRQFSGGQCRMSPRFLAAVPSHVARLREETDDLAIRRHCSRRGRQTCGARYFRTTHVTPRFVIQSQTSDPSRSIATAAVAAAWQYKQCSTGVFGFRWINCHCWAGNVSRPIPSAPCDEGRSASNHFRIAIVIG